MKIKVKTKMKTKSKTKTKTKTRMKTKTKTKIKTKMKNKMKTKTITKIKMNFCFCFHFVFPFRFCFCFWFLKDFAFLLTQRGLEVPQTVNCLLIGLEVPQHFVYKFCTWPARAIDGQLSLDWPRSAIAPRNMAPKLIRICRIQ